MSFAPPLSTKIYTQLNLIPQVRQFLNQLTPSHLRPSLQMGLSQHNVPNSPHLEVKELPDGQISFSPIKLLFIYFCHLDPPHIYNILTTEIW